MVRFIQMYPTNDAADPLQGCYLRGAIPVYIMLIL